LDKSKLSETDICEKFISPALQAAGWSIHEQVLREYPLRPGRMVVRGQRASRDEKSVLRANRSRTLPPKEGRFPLSTAGKPVSFPKHAA
jgi:hypothetical protein